MNRFEGKVVLITGGNSGIGLAAAKLFYNEGARVAISGRNRETLDSAVKLIGNDLLTVQADVSKIPQIDMFFTSVADKFGKFDVLFANAGIAKFTPLESVTEEEYDEQFNINAKGCYFTIQKALPHLNDGASIVLNTSVASHKGVAATTVYAATKAAMRSFTRSMAAELVGRQIRVNAVAPGPIATPIFDAAGLPQEAVDWVKESMISRIPMKRLGTVEEVAAAVAFLASSEASFITGVELDVDGGRGQL